jgi:hypothetical protein
MLTHSSDADKANESTTIGAHENIRLHSFGLQTESKCKGVIKHTSNHGIHKKLQNKLEKQYLCLKILISNFSLPTKRMKIFWRRVKIVWHETITYY